MEGKIYDLEQRTFLFARDCRFLLKKIPKTIQVIEDGKQLIRSSGSVGANYIEANEALSKKDFYYRIKICRKESKESFYWLSLLKVCNPDFERDMELLIGEADELKKIFSSILEKSSL
ncbi:four helix bundle protein [Flavobacterium cyanobacteriorum]|uniref:Four helix bundle protein n=1 Tax=Flavobacterium cyanobacteriorum TaxID=2022802 RepID=A0A255ZNY1_9FLAO|nr:four helix bundle protein [Flavobacterium cyanobacteriorum]OYQ43287.1 four helix bundle protein [Flavobacterium cyanobacteriorum]